MYYRNEMNFQYPDRCDEHMITVKHVRDVEFDENYPYLQKGWRYKLIRALCWLGLNCLLFWVFKFYYGLRVFGRKNLKKHKKALKNGAITISNHVFMLDFVCVMYAIRPHLLHFPAWKTNMEGPNGPFIRAVGGLPIPTGNIRAMIKFKRAMEEVLESKRWMHVFPEASMWFFYPDIRPLKPAVFKYAVKYDRPIIPIAMSFRPRRGIFRIFGKKKPCVDLHVGEPMFHDKSLTPREAVDKMHREAYHIMQVMAGINPGDPTYNTDQNLDHYQKTM